MAMTVVVMSVIPWMGQTQQDSSVLIKSVKYPQPCNGPKHLSDILAKFASLERAFRSKHRVFSASNESLVRFLQSAATRLAHPRSDPKNATKRSEREHIYGRECESRRRRRGCATTRSIASRSRSGVSRSTRMTPSCKKTTLTREGSRESCFEKISCFGLPTEDVAVAAQNAWIERKEEDLSSVHVRVSFVQLSDTNYI